MIKLRSIEKSYRHGLSQTFVLRRVSADIQQGEFVSIMGPSGAGKSTLLHIMGMHDSAWTGEYWLFDEPMHQLSAKDRMRLQKQHVGFVFQSYHLLDNLTVYENIDLPLSYRDVKKSERQGMVADILDRFNIVGKKDLYPEPAVRRSAAARRDRARGGRQAQPDSGRRADRQPPFGSGPRDHGAVQAPERRRDHDHPGDALGGERLVWPAGHQAEGRLDCRRVGMRQFGSVR